MGKTKLDETYIFKISIKMQFFYVAIGIKIQFFRVLVTIEPGLSLLQFVTTNSLINNSFTVKCWSLEKTSQTSFTVIPFTLFQCALLYKKQNKNFQWVQKRCYCTKDWMATEKPWNYLKNNFEETRHVEI